MKFIACLINLALLGSVKNQTLKGHRSKSSMALGGDNMKVVSEVVLGGEMNCLGDLICGRCRHGAVS